MPQPVPNVWRRSAAALIALIMIVALSMVSPVSSFAASTPGSSTAASDDQESTDGCNYGEDGPNASTICWIDMSEFDSAKAQSADG